MLKLLPVKATYLKVFGVTQCFDELSFMNEKVMGGKDRKGRRVVTLITGADPENFSRGGGVQP